MPRSSPAREEIARILQAEAEARRAVERAGQEVRRTEEDARRRAAEILEQARAACAVQRDRAFSERIALADETVRQVRSDADAEARAFATRAAQRLDAAAEAALIALLAEMT